MRGKHGRPTYGNALQRLLGTSGRPGHQDRKGNVLAGAGAAGRHVEPLPCATAGHFRDIPLQEYNGPIPWQVGSADRFKDWWGTASEGLQRETFNERTP